MDTKVFNWYYMKVSKWYPYTKLSYLRRMSYISILPSYFYFNIILLSYYEGILDFNQVEQTFTPITYEMISYHL